MIAQLGLANGHNVLVESNMDADGLVGPWAVPLTFRVRSVAPETDRVEYVTIAPGQVVTVWELDFEAHRDRYLADRTAWHLAQQANVRMADAFVPREDDDA